MGKSFKRMQRFRKRNPWLTLWECAKRRCEDTRHKTYAYCGALGIKFLITKHEVEYLYYFCGGPFLKCPSLDRIDATKDYTYANCRVIEKAINEQLPHNEKLREEWSD